MNCSEIPSAMDGSFTKTNSQNYKLPQAKYSQKYLSKAKTKQPFLKTFLINYDDDDDEILYYNENKISK